MGDRTSIIYRYEYRYRTWANDMGDDSIDMVILHIDMGYLVTLDILETRAPPHTIIHSLYSMKLPEPPYAPMSPQRLLLIPPLSSARHGGYWEQALERRCISSSPPCSYPGLSFRCQQFSRRLAGLTGGSLTTSTRPMLNPRSESLHVLNVSHALICVRVLVLNDPDTWTASSPGLAGCFRWTSSESALSQSVSSSPSSCLSPTSRPRWRTRK